MSIFNKINKAWLVNMQVHAKTTTKVYPIIGCIFVFVGLVILITETINGNIGGGIFGFVIIGGFGTLYFIARKINQRFLIKTNATDKTYKELGSDYIKAWKDNYEENKEK